MGRFASLQRRPEPAKLPPRRDRRPPAVSNPLQTKLAVNRRGDAYEQEADRAAERTMRMPDAAPSLQRKRACGDAETENAVPASVYNVLRSPGQPLDSTTRGFFERRFGHDFSKVRVHSDREASESARAVNALAYTVGQHVVFRAGQYSAKTAPGQQLLAHELAHVVQQSGPPTGVGNATAGRSLQREVAGGTARQRSSPGGGEKAGSCAGWERDPQSLSKRVVEHYLRRVWQPSWSVTSMACSPWQGGWECEVSVKVSGGVIKLVVRHVPGDPIVRVAGANFPSGPYYPCYYSFSCSQSGELRLGQHGTECPAEPHA